VARCVLSREPTSNTCLLEEAIWKEERKAREQQLMDEREEGLLSGAW
jgi:hypothetical protein